MRREVDREAVAALQRALRRELGLCIPFTANEYRAARDRVKARSGVAKGRQPQPPCTQQRRDGTFVILVPEELSIVEQEHCQFHQLAHVVLGHARKGKSPYTGDEERAAEAFADAMMARGLGTIAIG